MREEERRREKTQYMVNQIIEYNDFYQIPSGKKT